MKRCENCELMHNGMFRDCYQCHDCETEAEYNLRREDAEIIRNNLALLSEEEESAIEY